MPKNRKVHHGDSSGLTLGTIRAVTEALRTRSMTEAAQVLGVSQSAVTQQVNKFEAVTGIKLLRRVGNTLCVEREDIAELMGRITLLGQQMQRMLRDKATAKPTLTLPSAIATLIAISPEFSAWIAERYQLEVLSFRDLLKQRGQNSSHLLIRPVRQREANIDFMFNCRFILMKPLSMNVDAAPGDVLPVMFPAVECPTNDATLEHLQANGIAFAEFGRCEDISYRALNLSLGLCATPLPLGFAGHSNNFPFTTRCLPVGSNYPVQFGIEMLKQAPSQPDAMDFFETFCGQLSEFGVSMST